MDTQQIVCIQYCIIAIICACSLIYYIFVTNSSAEHSSELFYYKLAMAFTAVCSVSDIFYALREYSVITMSNTVNYITEIAYSLGSICGAYCWFIYSEKKQRSHTADKIFAIPFAIMCLITITTPLHKLNFSISGAEYVRGILNIPFTIICIAFIIFSGATALVNSFRKKHHSKTVLLRMLFAYSFFLVFAQILQLTLGPILPFRSLSATLVFMVITLRGMSETITIDALSNINNRFSLDHMLDNKILSGETFWLIMLDIDDFKTINDNYGHSSGDNAIRTTAVAICRAIPGNYFVARFGGDEFAIVAPPDEEATIASLEGKIRNELKQIALENKQPFTIDITSGYAKIDKSIKNIPDMIEKADEILYEKKRQKKVGR